MNEEKRIDNYFDRVKQNPPLIEIKKVHQILTKAEVKVKVEKGHHNLLRFTIMTTIFAIIISAFMFWPKAPEEIPNSNGEIPNEIVQTIDSAYVIEKEEILVAENKHIPVPFYKPKEDTPKTEEPKHEATETKEDEVINEPKPITTTSKLNFDPDTIQPINGSQFILKLTDEELAYIGIRTDDNSIIYKNAVNGYCYEYGSKLYKAYINDAPENYHFLTDERGREYIDHGVEMTFLRKNLFESETQADTGVVLLDSGCGYTFKYWPTPDTLSPTNFDFYPVYKSSKYYDNIAGNGTLDCSDFEMANDTLLPILFPKREENLQDENVILWFVLTKQLHDILASNHKQLINKLDQYKSIKKIYPEKNLINYNSPYKVEESTLITLKNRDLEKLGLRFYSDSVTYKGTFMNFSFSFMSSQNESKFQSFEADSTVFGGNMLSVFITNKNGSPKFNGLYQSIKENTGIGDSLVQYCIPVLVNNFGLYGDVIFWFLPTEGLFNALPDSISSDLRKEYNYIIAEDKSVLVKPECKYFDECKNTLDISSFKVFPNPANNNATVTFKVNEPIEGKISLVDLSGRERQVLQAQTSFTKGSHRIDVDVSTVPEGIYLITLYSDKGIQTQRFIVTH